MPDKMHTVMWRSARNRAKLGMQRVRGRLLRLGAGPLVRGGYNLLAQPGVEWDLYGTLTLGSHVFLSQGCVLRVGPGAHLKLGDGVFVGVGTVIAAHGSITVGNGTLVAEHASIRDSDHNLEPKARQAQQDQVEAVTVGQDVWIGAGARVLRGSVLGDAVVVAANSVVRGTVPTRCVVAGAPARVVKMVDESKPFKV